MFRNSRQLHIAVMEKYAAAQRIANTQPEYGSNEWWQWRSLLIQAAKLNDAYATAGLRNRIPEDATLDMVEVDVSDAGDVICAAV